MSGYDIATPYTSVQLLFRHEGKVAFILREHTGWMNGYYALPGGKAEKYERFTATAVREAKEETGVDILPTNLRHVLTVHRKAPDSLWVCIIFEVTRWKGELYNAEPHVHGELAWFELDKLPKNTLPTDRYFIAQIQAGQTYGEHGW